MLRERGEATRDPGARLVSFARGLRRGLAQPHQQKAVADAGLVRRARDLERHEAAVGRDDGVRRLPALVVVEVREAGEVRSRFRRGAASRCRCCGSSRGRRKRAPGGRSRRRRGGRPGRCPRPRCRCRSPPTGSRARRSRGRASIARAALRLVAGEGHPASPSSKKSCASSLQRVAGARGRRAGSPAAGAAPADVHFGDDASASRPPGSAASCAWPRAKRDLQSTVFETAAPSLMLLAEPDRP